MPFKISFPSLPPNLIALLCVERRVAREKDICGEVAVAEVSRPEPNTRVGYMMAAHSLEQALKNMQGQIKSLQPYQP